MADNFLERQREDYERRKQQQQLKTKRKKKGRVCTIKRPEDETL